MTFLPVVSCLALCVQLTLEAEFVLRVAHGFLGFFDDDVCCCLIFTGNLYFILCCILLLLGVSDYIIICSLALGADARRFGV